MPLAKQEFFDTMRLQGFSVGYGNNLNIISEEPSEQLRIAEETGDFSAKDPVPVVDISAPYTLHSRNKTPFVSAAMDTVTGSATCIVMADCGGRGTLPYSLDPDRQFDELQSVKKRLNGKMEEPRKISPNMTIGQLRKSITEKNFDFTNFPVCEDDGTLVGLMTNHKLKFSTVAEATVAERMVPINEVRVSRDDIDIHEAYQIMVDGEINMLPEVDEAGRLKAVFLFSDVQSVVEEDSGIRNVDERKRYVCDIAVPSNEEALVRIQKCLRYLRDGGGVAVLDTAYGDGYPSVKWLREIKSAFPEIDVMAGNVVQAKHSLRLVRNGADGVKIGRSSGRVCSTHDETGVGRGQLTAAWESSQALKESGYTVPICLDGGARLRGHPPMAIVAGATSVMMGSPLGATEESPGIEERLPDGTPVKIIRGMGSLPALQESAATRFRYGDNPRELPLPEGIVERVVVRGPLKPILMDFRRALIKSMVYNGATTIPDFFDRTSFELDLSRSA